MPTEAAVIKACRRGDLAQLRRWGRQEEFRVSTGQALVAFVANNRIDMVRCLVDDLGADVSQGHGVYGVDA
jgi:hypothetical protein